MAYYYVEDNPGVETTDNALATDPLHLDPEQLPKVEDPLDQDDCGQDPLQLEDLVQGSQHHMGFAEGPVFDLPVVRVVPVQPGCSAYPSEEPNSALATDPLRIEPELQAKNEVAVKQEDPLRIQEDPLQIEDFVQDPQCEFGAENDQHLDIPVVTVLPVETGCAAYPSDHDRPVSILLQSPQGTPELTNVHKRLTQESKTLSSNDQASGSGNANSAFKCTMCDSSFRLARKLTSHKRTVHCRFECNDCNETFDAIQELTRHRISHSKKSLLRGCVAKHSLARTKGYKKRRQRFKKKSDVHADENTPTDRSHRNSLKKKHVNNHIKGSFHCHLCPSSFHSKRAIEIHISRHTCKVCGLEFPSLNNPAKKKHFLTHNVDDESRVTCDICGRKVCDKFTLKMHMRRHFRDQRIKCSLCMNSYGQKKGLQYHMHTRHASELEFADKKRLEMTRKPNTDVFNCSICNASYATKPGILLHLGRHDNKTFNLGDASKANSSELLRCDVCSKTFNVKAGLLSHLRSHATREKRLLGKASIANSSELLRCDVCSKTFNVKARLISHLRSHSAKEKRLREANKQNTNQMKRSSVDETFATDAAMLSHLQSQYDRKGIEHSGVNKANYEELNSNDGDASLTAESGALAYCKSNNQNYSDKHNYKIDSEDKCSVCGETFNVRAGLLSHLRSHAEEELMLRETNKLNTNLVKCNLCDETFATKGGLESHLRKHNRNDMERRRANRANSAPLKCTICNAIFLAEAALLSHLQLHTALKADQQPIHNSMHVPPAADKHKCPTCYQEFDTQSTFDLHLSIHSQGNQLLKESSLIERNSANELPCNSKCNAPITAETGLLSQLKTHGNIELRGAIEANAEELNSFGGEATLNAKSVLSTCHQSQDGKDIKQQFSRTKSGKWKCSICNAVFKLNVSVHCHLRSHASKEMRLREANNLNPDLLKCSICNATFTGKSGLLAHLRSHDIKEIRRREARGEHMDLFKCHICNKTFVVKSGLSSHLFAHARKEMRLREAQGLQTELMRCSICDATFGAKSGLLIHLQSHAWEEMRLREAQGLETNCLKCDICGDTFTAKAGLKNHLGIHQYVSDVYLGASQGISEKLKNVEYNASFNAKPGPSPNLQSQNGDDVELRGSEDAISYNLTCSICNATLKTKEALSYHVLSHAATNDTHHKGGQAVKSQKRMVPSKSIAEILHCSHCNETFKYKSRLVSHIRLHSDNPSILCEICGQSILTSFKKSHMLKHASVKAYSCNMCKRSFELSKSLDNHLKCHMKSMQFRCNICRDFFQIKPDIEKHLTSVHKIASDAIDFSKHAFSAPSAPRYKCDECGLDYAQQGTLHTHIKTHHSNAPVLQCVVCNKTFARKSNLLNHMNLHTSVCGEFECEVCKLRFPTFQRMNAHLKNHFASKNFKCTICPGAFIDRQKLSIHMSVHSRARSFECELCGKKYKTSSAMKFHMKSHFKKDK